MLVGNIFLQQWHLFPQTGSPFALLDVQTPAATSIPPKPCKLCRLNPATSQLTGATAAAGFLQVHPFRLDIPRQSQGFSLPEESLRRCLMSRWHQVPLHGRRMNKAGNSSHLFLWSLISDLYIMYVESK